MIPGIAAVILLGGIAGGAALHCAQVRQEEEAAREAWRQQEEQKKEEQEEEIQLTPEEEKQARIAQVKAQAQEEGCPEGIIALIDKNEETLDFVQNYMENKDRPIPDTVEAPAAAGQIPHYLQWDERWGCAPYGTGTIAENGCGPTCMSMVIVGLTGDTMATPYRLVQYSEQNGFIDEANNTYWALMDSAARQWGISCREGMLDEASLAAELGAGHPVICSMLPGDFTDVGHFLVLTGYADGQVTLNDPFSIANTQKTWTYADIKDQIKEMWTFTAG